MTTPLVVYGAVMGLRSTSNDPRQWLPKDFAETDTYDWFQQHFGSDEFAVVSWDGCTLDNPQTDQLAAALQQTPFFDRVISASQILQELTSPAPGLSRSSAIRRLKGLLIGADGQATCLVLTTSATGQSDRVAAVREIERQAWKTAEIPATELWLAGPTVDAAAIDLESRRLLFQLAGLSALVSFLIATIRMRSVRLAIAVLSVAAYSTALALALMHFSGGRMNLLMTMLPPLIYVLTISSAVHLTNYYQEAIRGGFSTSEAPARALAAGWLPCSLAALTTAVGLISLATSKIDPIQKFGVYSALGVVASVAVLFLMLPAALRLFPPGIAAIVNTTNDQPSNFRGLIQWVRRYHLPIVVGGLAMMIVVGARIPSIQSTVRLQDRFLEDSDAVSDYRSLEQRIGPMVPLEVVIHVDKADARDQFQQLQLVAAVQRKIHSLDQPVATMSAVNLSPPLPTGRSIRHTVERNLINSSRTRQQWIDANFLRETADQMLWRITVRAPAIGTLDYGDFAEQIRAAVSPVLADGGARGTYTGVIPLIYKAQRQLLDDLFRSFMVAFVVIALVLMVVLRSIPAAILSMIPNVFPALIVFGGIQWVGIPVQIGSVMTASAALGIAVDDTVHLLAWFRRGMAGGRSRGAAIDDAVGHCAAAMIHTTLICSSGLLVFALSTFVPILHFAWLMFFLLLSALVGDLILLPAILAGPAGRFFEPKRKPLV